MYESKRRVRGFGWFIGEMWRQASACRNAGVKAEQCVERGHGRVASDGGGGLHPANWVCSLINSKAGELRGCPVALHINDLSAF